MDQFTLQSPMKSPGSSVLYSKRPSLEINLPRPRAWTLLHSAGVSSGCPSVSLLLSHPGININAVDDEYSTPLISVVFSSMAHPPRVVQLLAEGVGAGMGGDQGETALR